MNVTRIFAVVITLGVLSTASSGQETQKPTTPEGAKPTPAQPAAPPAAAPPPSSSAPKTGVVKDGEFIPTQEIQPDEDVTFPVDI
jgi:hypothetical protein